MLAPLAHSHPHHTRPHYHRGDQNNLKRVATKLQLVVGSGGFSSLFRRGVVSAVKLCASHYGSRGLHAPLVSVLREGIQRLRVQTGSTYCHRYNCMQLVDMLESAVGSALPLLLRHYQLTLPTTTALVHYVAQVSDLVARFTKPGWLGLALDGDGTVVEEFRTRAERLASIFSFCRLPALLFVARTLRAVRVFVSGTPLCCCRSCLLPGDVT